MECTHLLLHLCIHSAQYLCSIFSHNPWDVYHSNAWRSALDWLGSPMLLSMNENEHVIRWKSHNLHIAHITIFSANVVQMIFIYPIALLQLAINLNLYGIIEFIRKHRSFWAEFHCSLPDCTDFEEICWKIWEGEIRIVQKINMYSIILSKQNINFIIGCKYFDSIIIIKKWWQCCLLNESCIMHALFCIYAFQFNISTTRDYCFCTI